MAVGVLCAARGAAETLIVQAVEGSHGRLRVVRRCADLAELLAAAQAGLGGLAIVSGDLDLFDRESVAALHDAGVRVVAVADPDRAPGVELLAAMGVDLVVRTPSDEPAARELVDEALAVLERGVARRGDAVLADLTLADVAAWADEPHPGAPPSADGAIVAVWGPTGAPGRTTIAVNLAAELAAAGRSALLVDADTYGGSVAQVVGLLDEAPGLAAAARAARTGTLELVTLARLAPALAPDLRVLSGISRADRWPELGAASLEVVWSTARALASWTVVDCGFCLEDDEALRFDTRAPRRNAATLGALDAADVVVVVGAADPVGVQRLVRALDELSDRAPSLPRLVVVNRVRASVAGPRPGEAVREALERYAGVTDAYLVPDDGATLDAALLQGRTLREVAPGSAVQRAMTGLAGRLVALRDAPVGAVRRDRTGRLARVRR